MLMKSPKIDTIKLGIMFCNAILQLARDIKFQFCSYSVFGLQLIELFQIFYKHTLI